MSGCVAGAGDRSSLPQWRGPSATVPPTGRPRASTSIRRSGEAILGTEDHGIPGADFAVVLDDTIAEDDTKTVVHSRRQPTNQPFASLGSRTSASISAGSCSRRSHSAGSIGTRCMGTARVAAAGLSALNSGCAHSMMLLSQQMRIVIGGHRSNKFDRLPFARGIKTWRTSRALRFATTKPASDAQRTRQTSGKRSAALRSTHEGHHDADNHNYNSEPYKEVSAAHRGRGDAAEPE